VRALTGKDGSGTSWAGVRRGPQYGEHTNSRDQRAALCIPGRGPGGAIDQGSPVWEQRPIEGTHVSTCRAKRVFTGSLR
jgi:hypothetical protein